MADWGIRVSQKGYAVKTCADNELVMSSSFQNLKIYDVYNVEIEKPAGTTFNFATINHSFGFKVPALVVYNGSTTEGTGTAYSGHDGAGDPITILSGPFDVFVLAYGTQFPGAAVGDTLYFTVYVFYDDFRSIPERNIELTETVPGATSDDWGWRVSKEGFDVKTCADKDLVASSKFFNQIIHMKGVDATGTVTHNLGYIPNYLAFYFANGALWMVKSQITRASETELFNSAVQAGNGELYYIIFKNKTK